MSVNRLVVSFTIAAKTDESANALANRLVDAMREVEGRKDLRFDGWVSEVKVERVRETEA